MQSQTTEHLISLFEAWAGESVTTISPLPSSGSPREYYRLRGQHAAAIGAYNADRKENIAFLEFSRHFRRNGLPVPEIYAENLAQNVYLLQDLGDTTLAAYAASIRNNDDFPAELLHRYQLVIEQLPRFQIVAGKDLNYDVCYPRQRFDRQAMLWDVNYFKYYFLKFANITFDEQALEDDFQALLDFLLQADSDFFMYRDFQSRNIMLYQETPYFLDYQGGRKGALQYDVASLLYSSKANLPSDVKTELLQHYLHVVRQYLPIDEREFLEYYDGYVLIRLMQAMGAQGFRGFYEQKPHFLQSVQYALTQLKGLLKTLALPVALPALMRVFHELAHCEKLWQSGAVEPILQVSINSFSYKRGIPIDESGNGGGYVFDCRALPNPGRDQRYQHLTGQDIPVIEFLRHLPEVDRFLSHVYALSDQSIAQYQRRGFSHLTISFGCTGGQHRSVYCAEMLKKHVEATHQVKVLLRHRELEMKSSLAQLP